MITTTPPAFKKLPALGQLALGREYPQLLPCLLGKGLGVEDALAVAYNAALLSRTLDLEPGLSPMEVLNTYSLREIAELCELYRRVEAGELEYGGREAPQ